MRWTPRKLQTGHPPKRMKVTFPVNIVQIRVTNGTSAVDHHTIADIDTNVVETTIDFEEDQIAFDQILFGNARPFVDLGAGITG